MHLQKFLPWHHAWRARSYEWQKWFIETELICESTINNPPRQWCSHASQPINVTLNCGRMYDAWYPSNVPIYNVKYIIMLMIHFCALFAAVQIPATVNLSDITSNFRTFIYVWSNLLAESTHGTFMIHLHIKLLTYRFSSSIVNAIKWNPKYRYGAATIFWFTFYPPPAPPKNLKQQLHILRRYIVPQETSWHYIKCRFKLL
jgi:hypothetical protein